MPLMPDFFYSEPGDSTSFLEVKLRRLSSNLSASDLNWNVPLETTEARRLSASATFVDY
jgi:hypothetical protein